MSPDFSASFFNYDTVEVHEQANEVALLVGRPQSDWAKVLAHTETRRFSPGETIITAGETDRTLYLLTEGSLGVRLDGQTNKTFKAIDAPSVVGEVAFLDGGPRSATLFAITEGELLRLRMESFETLAAREPELGRAILFDLARIVTARLRLASDVIARSGG
jgi:CRP/FNR family transcriptional regulator, cyclic AMP receptor protein